MKIVTYLGFTLLSILIQFCVMDFIQERQVEKSVSPNNATSPRKHLKDVVKDIKFKPLAIYYQTKSSLIKNDTAIYVANVTESDDNIYTSTDYSTTLLEDYFDNATFTVETFTVEPTTEFDNITEITIFGKSNDTTPKPSSKPKKSEKNCHCNFLYKVCDIGCCCDDDCTNIEIKMFPNCGVKNISVTSKHEDSCYSSLINFSQDGPAFKILDSLFCIIKINLPEEKRVLKYANFELDRLRNTNQFMMWKNFEKLKTLQEYSNKIYEYGDIVGVLKNDTVSNIEIPSILMNSYCTGRKPIVFLKDESFSCKVKISDLEILKIMSNIEYPVLSATTLSMNHTVVNCSNAHCTNWTILVCNNLECQTYNKSLHEPFCTERTCTNLALRITYTFYYHQSKITNATIRFDLQNITLNLHYLEQNIEVKFVLANESIDNILKLSGNPGYIEGLPVIVSGVSANHTQNYFNTTTLNKKYFSIPINKNGVCVPAIENVIVFARNIRTTCKLYHEDKILQNRTMECKGIQENIYQFLSLTQNVSISPLGNPQELKDNDWMLLNFPIKNKEPLFGKLKQKISKLYCYNLNARFFWIFSYANVNGNNKILSVRFDYTERNITLNTEDAFTIITIDINFIDVTKPSVYETPTGPNLNLRLPNDFFYPFNSSGNSLNSFSGYILSMILLLYKMFSSE